MVEVSSSLLNVKEDQIVQKIYDLEVAGTNYFHIDVMDGKFVQNETIEKMRKYTEYIKQISTIPIEVHLMVNDTKSYIDTYIGMEVNNIIIHLESCKNETQVLELISYIKQNNVKAGISIRPNTDIEKVYEYLPYIHNVLVMTVEPGKGGQELLLDTIEKIRKLNTFIYENGYDIDIEVDGGINDKTAKQVTNAGANILVAGSYIINSDNYKEAISKLKK